MKFKLEIEIGNEGMSSCHDVATALKIVANKVHGNQLDGRILDGNGNVVGRYFIK